MEKLLTPERSVEIKNRVKDSKFIGNIKCIDSKQKAEEYVDKIKDKYHDATHNVSAYKIGTGDRALKYSDDDGEPAGSSGPPVLQAIEGAGLTNTVVVVTRYFGGTKLGIGGLIRAYGDTAQLVIEEAGKKELRPVAKLKIAGKYEHIGTIMGQIEAMQGKIIESEYDNDGAVIKFLLKPDKIEQLKNRLKEMTGDSIRCKKLKEFLV